MELTASPVVNSAGLILWVGVVCVVALIMQWYRRL